MRVELKALERMSNQRIEKTSLDSRDCGSFRREVVVPIGEGDNSFLCERHSASKQLFSGV